MGHPQLRALHGQVHRDEVASSTRHARGFLCPWRHRQCRSSRHQHGGLIQMSRLGTNASRRLAPWLDRGLNRASVGSVTSASDAVNKINAFVIDASPKHDLSTESWRAVWIGRFGHDDSQPDGLGRANKGGISTLLDDIDACAPGYAGGCDRATDDTFNSMNQDLGLAADNGWMTFQQLMGWLGRYPVNADDSISPASPPLPPSDPLVIDDRDRMYAAM